MSSILFPSLLRFDPGSDSDGATLAISSRQNRSSSPSRNTQAHYHQHLHHALQSHSQFNPTFSRNIQPGVRRLRRQVNDSLSESEVELDEEELIRDAAPVRFDEWKSTFTQIEAEFFESASLPLHQASQQSFQPLSATQRRLQRILRNRHNPLTQQQRLERRRRRQAERMARAAARRLGVEMEDVYNFSSDEEEREAVEVKGQVKSATVKREEQEEKTNLSFHLSTSTHIIKREPSDSSTHSHSFSPSHSSSTESCKGSPMEQEQRLPIEVGQEFAAALFSALPREVKPILRRMYDFTFLSELEHLICQWKHETLSAQHLYERRKNFNCLSILKPLQVDKDDMRAINGFMLLIVLDDDFHRFLTHSICQFHQLNAVSVNSRDKKNQVRVTRISKMRGFIQHTASLQTYIVDNCMNQH